MKSAWLALALALSHAPARAETCIASFYDRGSKTANGESFNPYAMTAAHLRYPFGSILRVTDLATRHSALLRVNDRGPARWTGHCLDATRGAARRLGFEARGTTRVRIERVR